MPKKPKTAKKKQHSENPSDPNLLAHAVAEAAIGEPLGQREASSITEYLAQIGRKGGLKGGHARAQKLPAKKRSEIAKKAARKRWGKDL